ncbi:MerR family transcriptional regulator [Vulgatibacter sp.]|uniref:MerR family transcriptional regulator n=1 Tax=Vulgatibacter sp. TaxID=1971226 RepID=UPI0035679DB8
MRTILSPAEIQEMERELGASGVTAAEVLAMFRSRGVRLSEGTFRKYVQVGLLPRSRRVGTKGKHRGSRGVYPVAVIRRLNAIKAMMAEGMTLDEIRGSFLYLRGELDVVEQGLDEIGARLERSVAETQLAPRQRERLQQDLARVRESAARLTERIERLAGHLVAARAAAHTDREGT